MNREELLKESTRRIKKLGLMQECINAFVNDNQVWESEFDGILYNTNEEEQEIIKDFENKHNCIVYHIIKSYTNFGTILNLLYVNEYKDEWEYFDSDLESGLTMVYAKNLDDDFCSEFGSIGIKAINGGLKRVA